jgi:hypothetical protein
MTEKSIQKKAVPHGLQFRNKVQFLIDAGWQNKQGVGPMQPQNPINMIQFVLV